MVRHGVPFDQLELVLHAQFPENPPDVLAHLPQDRALAVLRHKHDVVAAVLSHVRQVFPLSHDCLLSRERSGSWSFAVVTLA